MLSENKDYLIKLIKSLSTLTNENEWVEFKINNTDPNMIGEYISALSNSATLVGKENGYLIWGIDNVTHRIIGTNFNYKESKKGSEELELWLSRMLNPKINFKFNEVFVEGKKVVILTVSKSERQPTQFAGIEYLRIGSNKKKLKEYPEKEKILWKSFDDTPYELKIAKFNNELWDIFNALDLESYYKSLGLILPDNKVKIIDDLLNEKFIKKNDAGLYDITNYGALLISKDITYFENLLHKYIRVIWYKENTRLETIKEKRFNKGYIVSYEEVIDYIMTIIPQKEIIENSIRKTIFSYPEIAIREIVANILIHQSIEQKGTSPMIEIFSDRIEFSNPGAPLISVNRIIDTVPISRNENIAGFMHRCGICEERGSGYDKILFYTSQNQMIAPKIENQNDKFTKVILFSKIPFDLISKEDKIRTCYMYACLMYVQGEPIDNNSIRKLFGISENEKYKASRIIKDTIESNLIKPVDVKTAPRYMKYIPFWS